MNMNNESIKKTFFKFAVPSIVGLLIVSMQTMIDGIFVGNYVGPRGLAAINISMPYVNIIMSVGMMITAGGGVISAIHLGGRDERKAGESASFTLLSLVTILGAITVLSLLFMNELIVFLGADNTLFPMVKAYLAPMVALIIFYCAPIYTETFARIGGKPNAVFLSGTVCCLTNIFLDYIFIGKLGWGISGAAYATGIANLLGSLALIGLFFKKRSGIQLYRPAGDMKLLKNLLYNGSSEMLTVVSAAVATFLFNRIIMEYIGEMGVSALTIVFYVNNIVNISLYGLAQALQPIVSYNLGAKRIDRIYDTLKISLTTGGIIGLTSFFLMKFYSKSLIQLFTKGDIELTRLALEAAGYFIFAYLISFINIISSSFHTAVEKPMESAGIALLRSLIFVAVFLTVLPHIIGEKGIWMAVPMAELSCLVVSLLMMNTSLKKIESASSYSNIGV